MERIDGAVQRERLLGTARDLVAVPSRTGEAGACADRLAEILEGDGVTVERVIAGHHAAPAVVARVAGRRPGKTLQFDGHLDTVHLPFMPPGIDGQNLTGSGASDMKGGVAAAVEALRVLRETEVIGAGSVLFTAHDLHEAPWGLGQQLDALIEQGIRGDAILIPEPLSTHLPVAGRGSATWKATLRRAGPPVHEVLRPTEPSALLAGVALAQRLAQWDEVLGRSPDPRIGAASVFVGQIHSGAIYNEFAQECWLEGTRRWLPGADRKEVESEFKQVVQEVAARGGVRVEVDFRFVRDAFLLDLESAIVPAFDRACAEVRGAALPRGPKAFVDDGNSFWGLAGLPAITHGPRAGGQHTLSEWVSIDDMVRVARVYCRTAIHFLGVA